MTTNNEQTPVVLVTNAVPKPRAKGQALWTPFSLRRLSRCAPFSPVEKESVAGWTVSETVSKRGGRVVKNSGELNQINIEFTGDFAILLNLNHAFRSQRAVPTNSCSLVSIRGLSSFLPAANFAA
ncbi:MAG: hypothetical protein PHY43_04670 [Verrucomicrobiales bacterium]|nr:hypothetical protein [Verrucomicrobiales bacterium]